MGVALQQVGNASSDSLAPAIAVWSADCRVVGVGGGTCLWALGVNAWLAAVSGVRVCTGGAGGAGGGVSSLSCTADAQGPVARAPLLVLAAAAGAAGEEWLAVGRARA
jgi:hypothetical protein